MGKEPIDWTDEMIDDLCAQVAGGASILSIAGKNGFPSYNSIYQRLAKDEKFAAKLGEARAAQQEHEADYCVQLADSCTPEDWQVAKLQIWARQWRAAKLAPKKYGDKQQVEHTGNLAHTHMTLDQFKARMEEGA